MPPAAADAGTAATIADPQQPQGCPQPPNSRAPAISSLPFTLRSAPRHISRLKPRACRRSSFCSHPGGRPPAAAGGAAGALPDAAPGGAAAAGGAIGAGAAGQWEARAAERVECRKAHTGAMRSPSANRQLAQRTCGRGPRRRLGGAQQALLLGDIVFWQEGQGISRGGKPKHVVLQVNGALQGTPGVVGAGGWARWGGVRRSWRRAGWLSE